MGRKILFITTDQQRYDALAASGIVYRRAYNQNTVCMPARSTMLTGQYVRTHGVFANGIPLPLDAPSVAAHLQQRAGYRTALLAWETWDRLRTQQGCSVARARRVLETALTRLLEPTRE